MANPIIASAPKRGAAELHMHAVSVLDEWRGEIDRIFAVAAAGRVYCGEHHPLHQSLFQVIEDMLSDGLLPKMLRERIDDLARSAGVSEGVING